MLRYSGKLKIRSNLFDSSTVNTSDCVENKLNMITKTASPHLCSSTGVRGGGGVRQQLWFPSISFLGGLPGQMGQPDVTCVKRECLYPTVSPLCLALAIRINSDLRWKIWATSDWNAKSNLSLLIDLRHIRNLETVWGTKAVSPALSRLQRSSWEQFLRPSNSTHPQKQGVPGFQAHSWFQQEIARDLQGTRNFNLDTAWLKSLGSIIMEHLRISRTSSRGEGGKN